MSWLERSWYGKGYLSFILIPFTVLFWLVTKLRKLLFKFGIKKQITSDIPVIVVGNITVGGTGKTPFAIYLVNLLKKQGFKPAIVSRGYGAEQEGHSFPRLVTDVSPVSYSGDEPKLLAMRTQVPVVISPKRVEAVRFVEENTDCDVIISDDGLQHYAMGRHLEIVLIDEARGLGNSWLLPVGPLREAKSRLQTVDITVYNSGFTDGAGKAEYSLVPSAPNHIADANKILEPGAKVKLISGIGNPQRFLDTALGLGLQVDAVHWLPDHHNFTTADFVGFSSDDIVVMTEKDAVKCTELDIDLTAVNWFVLPIEAKISAQLEQQILTKLTQLKKRQKHGF